jgi:hypothetical protein
LFTFFFVVLQPSAGHGLILEGFLDHTQRCTQSVRLLWTSDQLGSETST